MPNLGLEIKRRCGICGKVFIIKTLDSLYCCKKCSDVAYARKKRAEAREKQLALIAKSVPKVREYLSIREAVAIYGVERDTLYLMVRRGQIPSINIGTRLTRINRKDLEKMFVKRPIAKHIKETPLPKKYSLEPEDCYTIGEVCEKYHITRNGGLNAAMTSMRQEHVTSRSKSITVNFIARTNFLKRNLKLSVVP